MAKDNDNMSGALLPQQTEHPKKGSLYVPSLDGIRAVSVMVVFVAHAGLQGIIPGNFGVTVFLFLSGYLITTLMRMEHEKTGGVNLKHFYLRRILRILPPFYLVLLVASMLTLLGALEGSLNIDSLLYQGFHLSNYYIINEGWWAGRAPGTWVFWSLAVEEHFYLVFPLVYLFLQRWLKSRRQQILTLAGLCMAVLAWRCVLVFGSHVSEDRTYMASDTRIDSILFGCILAISINPVLDRISVSDRWWKWFWLPAGLVGLLISFVVRNPQFQETFRYTLQGLALFPLFIIAIRYHNWGIFRLLNVGWVKFVGALSYSLYLVHPTIIYGVEQWLDWHPIVLAAVSLGLSLSVAALIYHLVEKPCIRLKKLLSENRSRRPARLQVPYPMQPLERTVDAR